MTYLSHTPYTPPDYEHMTARNALMKGTSEAMYRTSMASVNSLKSVTVSAIAYDSDGLRVTGMEVLPVLEAGEKVPLLIYNRGGSGDYGMLSPGQVNALMAPFAMRARMGVLATNYRGNGDSEGTEEFGGADVRDVLQLIEIGRAQDWWDGKNIFMLGWSRGGMMTYRAIAEGAELNAAVVGAGMTDMFQSAIDQPDIEDLFTRRIPGYPANREEALQLRSAVCWPEKINVPLLLLHGDADDRIGIKQARDLRDTLAAQGSKVQLIEYAGGDHALRREWQKWVKEALDWFAAHRR